MSIEQAEAQGGTFARALLGLGLLAGACAFAVRAGAARAAAAQVWPPFVLVSGLLLVGLVAEQDGLFAAAGHRIAGTARHGLALFAASAVLVTVVTALLNLDTSVAFLTPVLVHAARSRDEPEVPLLVACVLLSNAASLFLPGSNLTNLIVLGHLHISGHEYLARMWLPATTAVVVTALVIGVAHRHHLRAARAPAGSREPVVVGLGLAAVVAVTLCVLVLRSPAIPVAVIGVAAVAGRVARRRTSGRRALDVLGLPVLVGLFGLAVAFGTLGRVWSGPATLLARLGPLPTAALGAVSSVAVNNLPAASLLAAHPPDRPFALLIGLDLGPNLFVTGSLAWFLWLRAARGAGASPPLRSATRIGAVAAPLALVVATAALVLVGSR
jgi:arsenical pump membrane protein